MSQRKQQTGTNKKDIRENKSERVYEKHFKTCCKKLLIKDLFF